MATRNATAQKRQDNPRVIAVTGAILLVGAGLFVVAVLLGPRYDVVPAVVLSLASGLYFGRLAERYRTKRGVGLRE